jgi:hypothetical protein
MTFGWVADVLHAIKIPERDRREGLEPVARPAFLAMRVDRVASWAR